MLTASQIVKNARQRQKDITDKEKDYAIYYGKDHDLLISLPHTSKLTRNYKIYFSKKQSKYLIATIYSGKYTYKLLFNSYDLLFEEKGYYAIKGKYPQQKGLHNQPLHRLAYIAFYGNPPPGYHVHHIDRDKHNLAMDNLVALTEAEHSAVHKRDVSVGRTLFNQPKRKSLLDALSEQREQSESSDVSEYEDRILHQVEGAISSGLETIQELLEKEPTNENMKKLIDRVLVLNENTVLDLLCRYYISQRNLSEDNE